MSHLELLCQKKPGHQPFLTIALKEEREWISQWTPTWKIPFLPSSSENHPAVRINTFSAALGNTIIGCTFKPAARLFFQLPLKNACN